MLGKAPHGPGAPGGFAALDVGDALAVTGPFDRPAAPDGPALLSLGAGVSLPSAAPGRAAGTPFAGVPELKLNT